MAVTINGSTGWTYSDNIKHKYGTGEDLEIFHESDQNYLTSSNGRINLRASESRFENAAGNEVLAKFIDGGACELRYNDSAKLVTTDTGVKIQNAGNNRVLKLDHTDGDHCYITFMDDDTSDDGQVRVGALNNDLLFLAGGSERLRIQSDGTVKVDGGPLEVSHTSCHIDFMEDSTTNHRLRNGSGNFYIQKISDDKSTTTTQFSIDGGTGSLSLYHDGTEKLRTDSSGIGCHGDCYPINNNSYDVGNSSSKWDDVYATNGTIQTSDRNAKKDIVKSDLGLTFINAVEPVSYKFKTGTRTHYGVIAQDLETVLDGKDFAGLTKDTETGNYGLRYTELISPLIKAVQELSAEVNTLKTEIAALKTA